ncbi:probable carbohydrate esterase at4g34215 [Phtheirospermum japonicum]|uniref:Probable carbohydrate esterase at4g34215 n=1 Tax=Phtheirospermum japonicum TaxID=374723 RepID=A0A830B470_9LAMI|nr:probable carbohydrate esterase at4g34215 [Phtheirospermum japonicum]
MVGRGGLINGTTLVVPPECQPNPQILRLNPELAWEEAREALHAGIDKKTCGIGPGLVFANSVLQRDPNIGVIGLVPCAVGGTSISQWLPGSELYVKMLSRAQAALSSGGGQIQALLWYQGENDMVNEATAYQYKTNLETLFTQLRSDLQLPNLRVALASTGKVGKPYFGTYFDVVRSAQLEMPSLLPNVKCVDALGLEVNSFDYLHLTAEAEVKLGKMMAAAFLN